MMPHGQLHAIVHTRWWVAPLFEALTSYFQFIDAELPDGLIDWIYMHGVVVVGAEWRNHE